MNLKVLNIPFARKFSMNYYKQKFLNKSISTFLILNTLISIIPLQINSAKAFEFQWGSNDGYKRLKWHQRTAEKNSRNKIFFFFMPKDRKTGLLSINIKIPKNFKSTLRTQNITICKAKYGGYISKTKCIEDVPSDIVFDEENKRLEIYPISPVPSNEETYAVVFKINNPRRSGLYQFHSFGKSSGPIPVSSYLGSWTLTINP